MTRKEKLFWVNLKVQKVWIAYEWGDITLQEAHKKIRELYASVD